MATINDKEFANRIESLADWAKMLIDSITTEEGTKQGLIVPMFDALGYDVWDSREFCPEFVADVGIKKGEKVDYTILNDGEPEILVECNSCKTGL